MSPTRTSQRPRLRGASHRVAFYVAIVAGIVLVAATRNQRATVATAIYAVLLAGMFGASATLHRRAWGPRAYGWLRRADHAMIFACIAGTYTPFCVLGLGGPVGFRLLTLVWVVAGLGIVRAVAWPHAPRAVTAVLFVIAGWVMAIYFPEVRAALGVVPFVLLMVGGGWFTLGAVVYLVKRPDPWPRVFGYHELFHVMIIVGCVCHFVAVEQVALSSAR